MVSLIFQICNHSKETQMQTWTQILYFVNIFVSQNSLALIWKDKSRKRFFLRLTFYQQSDVLKDLRSARKWVWNCIGSLAIYYTDWGKSLSALGVRNNGCGGGRHDFLSSLTVNRNYISMIHYRYRSYTQLVKRPVFCRRSLPSKFVKVYWKQKIWLRRIFA